MPVTQASSSAFEQHDTLTMLFHFGQKLARITIINDRSARHFDNLILAILTETATFATTTTIGRHDMLLVFQMQQRPQITIALKDDMSSTASITTVRTAFWHIFSAVKVHTPGTSFARTAIDLNVIDEIA